MRRSSVAGFLAGTALASALVGGAAWAASPTPSPAAAAPTTSSSSTRSSGTTTSGTTSKAATSKAARAHRPAALLGRASHAQVTLTTKKGDRTVLVQRGTVTAVTQPSGTTPGSVTVVSTDRFTATYALPSAAGVHLAKARGATTPGAATTLKIGERVRLTAHTGPGGGTASVGAVRVLPAVPAGGAAAAAPAAGN